MSETRYRPTDAELREFLLPEMAPIKARLEELPADLETDLKFTADGGFVGIRIDGETYWRKIYSRAEINGGTYEFNFSGRVVNGLRKLYARLQSAL